MRAQVGDFGLSRTIHGEVIGTAMGTVTHMPPETLADGTVSKVGAVFCWVLHAPYLSCNWGNTAL